MCRFAIIAYHGVEPIDIGATYGVLSMARRVLPDLDFFLVAPDAGEVELANGLRISAQHDITSCPTADFYVVLGGPGYAQQCRSAAMLDFLTSREDRAVIASVCTGAMILAAAGLLDGKPATTRRLASPGEAVAPLAEIGRSGRIETQEAVYVDAGRIVTGGGVSLATDLTLHLLARAYGPATADGVARLIEYDRAWQANRDILGVFDKHVFRSAANV